MYPNTRNFRSILLDVIFVAQIFVCLSCKSLDSSSSNSDELPIKKKEELLGKAKASEIAKGAENGKSMGDNFAKKELQSLNFGIVLLRSRAYDITFETGRDYPIQWISTYNLGVLSNEVDRKTIQNQINANKVTLSSFQGTQHQVSVSARKYFLGGIYAQSGLGIQYTLSKYNLNTTDSNQSYANVKAESYHFYAVGEFGYMWVFDTLVSIGIKCVTWSIPLIGQTEFTETVPKGLSNLDLQSAKEKLEHETLNRANKPKPQFLQLFFGFVF